MTDGNTYAINKHLDEREDYDALQEVTAELEQAEARIEELEGRLAELLVVVKHAVRLSLDHSDFKLYAMDPLQRAIAAAELKGQDDE